MKTISRSAGAIRTRRTCYGHQEKQSPSTCIPGNNINNPGKGMACMPSWLDYCFEYEAVALGSSNKDNNLLACKALGDCGTYSRRCAITKKNQR
jgi:hypothetical protein